MTCFKTNASFASAQRKALRGGGGVLGNRGNSGGRGVPGNRGNSGGQGAPGNRGNTTAGRKKKLAGKRSALRRSAKLLLVEDERGDRIHLALSEVGGRIVGQCHITDSFAVDAPTPTVQDSEQQLAAAVEWMALCEKEYEAAGHRLAAAHSMVLGLQYQLYGGQQRKR